MSAPSQLLVGLNRFGLGGRGAAAIYLGSPAADPRAFLREEIAAYATTIPQNAKLGSSQAILQGLFEAQEETRLARVATATAAATTPPPPNSSDTASQTRPAPPADARYVQAIFRAEALARIQAAAAAPTGVCERLVAFWSNHFAVAANKSPFVRAGVGAFEREAIRPHIFGRFADMARAVEQHPVMLHYLDNQLSTGPHSRGGQNQNRGLNENLARETMELHTLGVGGGYTQADVTSLARILTGWTYAGPPGRIAAPGAFAFVANWHEPGPALLLGKTYPQNGVEQGEAALSDLAQRPVTAAHIARKLAAHFVADDPPASLAQRLTAVFQKTYGDLKAVTLALIDAPEAWSTPLTKMRDPWDLLLAITRLFDHPPDDPNRILGAMNQLGQPLWTPPAPNGFPDTNDAWASPESLKLRLDLSQQVARQLRDPPDPRALLEGAFGAAVSDETRQTVARAETKQQAVALILMSPEMQRR